ncbi:MAG: oxamate carbamoyltransferase subunit AllH family protein [Candidatus Kariarchaeaceae archaeon]|jgi:hypothetical protein
MFLHRGIIERNIQKNKYEQLLERLDVPLKRFQEEIHQPGILNAKKMNTIFSDFLGIGKGSTPQSDDVFLGVLTVMSIIEPNIAVNYSYLATMKYETFTTKKSSILIRKFLLGNFPREVQKLIRLLKRKDQMDKFESEIRKIKVIGASSGLFFLVGLLWQFRYYEKIK